MTNTSVIKIKNVDKYYNGYSALNNITLDVKKGQIYSYLGPNGSGKTTTIKIILGLLKPTSGSVKILGEDPSLDNAKSLNVRRHMGSMLEWDGLNLNLTGLENLIFFAKIYGQNKADSHVNAVNVIKKVELSKWADETVSKYSHGMRKRLAFARALINDPDILVLDEPTSGVDPESRILLRNLITSFVKNGRTVFFSSHDLEEVQKVSNSLSLLNKGKIIFNGSLDEVRKTFGKTKVYIQLKNNEIANSLAGKLGKKIINLDINGPILSFIPKQGYKNVLENEDIISSWTMESSLEEAYINAISPVGDV